MMKKKKTRKNTPTQQSKKKKKKGHITQAHRRAIERERETGWKHHHLVQIHKT
jgi:hypothetical protein